MSRRMMVLLGYCLDKHVYFGLIFLSSKMLSRVALFKQTKFQDHCLRVTPYYNDILAMEITTTRLRGCLAIAGLLFFFLWPGKRNPLQLTYPPGPKGLPFPGAILDVPALSDKPWLVYDKWFKKYGEFCFGLNVCGSRLIRFFTRRHHIF